jgi:D-sedoheptulose 7-phosphate isomerase
VEKNGAAAGYLSGLVRTLDLVPSEPLAAAIRLLLDARATGRRVYIMGNGGSATTASHFACDLVKTAHVADHAPLRVFALTDNTPLLTAWANDRAYEDIFAEQIVALAEPGDVVIAISASGNSPNIVAGLAAAASIGGHTIGLLGFDGGAARRLVDIAIHIPCDDYGLVEDTHAAIGHAITGAIRAALLADPGASASEAMRLAVHAESAR